MRNLWIAGGVLLVLGVASAALFGGRGDSELEDPARQKVVYVCTETGKVVTAPAGPVPGNNAETGRATLMPGLYCEKCKKWYASAPFEVAQRNPASRNCPKHRTPMRPNGPI